MGRWTLRRGLRVYGIIVATGAGVGLSVGLVSSVPTAIRTYRISYALPGPDHLSVKFLAAAVCGDTLKYTVMGAIMGAVFPVTIWTVGEMILNGKTPRALSSYSSTGQ